MPPKPKLHKNVGKSKLSTRPPLLNPTPESSTASTSNGTTDNSELERQFEVELCWCIQQLQIALKSGKLNERQVQDNVKACNTLMSNTAPMIKKRQVMRNSFGDYRAKMAAESQKLSKGLSQLKVVAGTPNKKSSFVKKSVFSTKSESDFKFNFDVLDADDSTEMVIVEANEKKKGSTDQFHFTISNNSFRFNFSSDNENVDKS